MWRSKYYLGPTLGSDLISRVSPWLLKVGTISMPLRKDLNVRRARKFCSKWLYTSCSLMTPRSRFCKYQLGVSELWTPNTKWIWDKKKKKTLDQSRNWCNNSIRSNVYHLFETKKKESMFRRKCNWEDFCNESPFSQLQKHTKLQCQFIPILQ